ncbi:MAG: DUF2304 domain-containing protein [Kiritimatiellae bacterium]|nr:DUF2304 domain-containing protein [Kiritimatiellia bacterium]
MITPRQMWASFIISVCLVVMILRLVQRGKLDIAYCWLWLVIGLGIVLCVTQYRWLVRFGSLIGSLTPTTTVFLTGLLVVLVLCLQFSLVISAQRRQIKRLTQQLAILRASRPQGGEAKV